MLNWSALRGAVGLCGALIVASEIEFPIAYKNATIFYTSGIVILTILINGSTCGWIMEIIGLTKLHKNQIEDYLELSLQVNDVCLEFYQNDNIPMLSKILCNKIKI